MEMEAARTELFSCVSRGAQRSTRATSELEAGDPLLPRLPGGAAELLGGGLEPTRAGASMRQPAGWKQRRPFDR